jgi:hypothetical protein
MAASLTTFAVNQILLEMKDGTGTIPTTFYAALFSTTPGIDGTGGVEISSGAHTWYGRQDATLDTISGRTIANTSAVTFTNSAGSAAGTMLSLGLLDASTSGNLWWILPLTTPLTIGVGSQVNFPAGQIVAEFTST